MPFPRKTPLYISVVELCSAMQNQKKNLKYISFLFNEINELKQVRKRLKSKNKEFKYKLAGFKTKKNSDNSSKSPSSDFDKLKKIQSVKKNSGRKVGGQSEERTH